MLIIPINDVYAQSLRVTLASQSCSINIYQKSTGLYVDLLVSDQLIIGGVLCRDRNFIVLDLYLGFIGDLGFYDTQGFSDPSSPGLGTRFLLAYLQLSDLAGLG
jgi:hypothetical protein